MRRYRYAVGLLIVVMLLAIGVGMALGTSVQGQRCIEYVSPPIPVPGWTPPPHLPPCSDLVVRP